jgi:hypothetical protein
MKVTLPIKMESTVRDKFRALWMRLKGVDFDIEQGETLEMAVDALIEKLDKKAMETMVGH